MPENKDDKDHKDHAEEAFKVVDRRLFTAEGDLREEAVQQERKERLAAEAAAKTSPKAPEPPAQQTPAKQDAPQPLAAFKSLVSLLAENAVMYAGAYADPRTGEPIVEPEALRSMIDMLDALREKTRGNLAPEEDALIVDLSGKLKMTYLELSKAAAQPVRQKAKARP
ncbi:MAG TPA: DUF1844 domain-containing protein [Candidatus Acidoferrales bacterium]|nr:DUF1844 domain-containing protein [Candidatus Acidoferrales bacterium]